jgi:hypothetical protein
MSVGEYIEYLEVGVDHLKMVLRRERERIRQLEDVLKQAREYILLGEGQPDYDEMLMIIDQALGEEGE